MAFFFCSPGNGKDLLLDSWCHLLPTDGVQALLSFSAALEMEKHLLLNSWCRQLQQDGVQAWRTFSAALPVENKVSEIADRCQFLKK
jgi:hypothetical protein